MVDVPNPVGRQEDAGTQRDPILDSPVDVRALDQERLLSKNLASQLDEKTSGYDKLRDELQEAETKIRHYESETEDLQSALDQAREAGRALERRQNELAEEIKAAAR